MRWKNIINFFVIIITTICSYFIECQSCKYCHDIRRKRQHISEEDKIYPKITLKSKKDLFEKGNAYINVMMKSGNKKKGEKEYKLFFFEENTETMNPYTVDESKNIKGFDILSVTLAEIKSHKEKYSTEETHHGDFKFTIEGKKNKDEEDIDKKEIKIEEKEKKDKPKEKKEKKKEEETYYYYLKQKGLKKLFKSIPEGTNDGKSFYINDYLEIKKNEKSKNISEIKIFPLNGIGQTEYEVIEIYFININALLEIEVLLVAIEATDLVECILRGKIIYLDKDNNDDNEKTFEQQILGNDNTVTLTI